MKSIKTNELYDTITVSCECKQQRINIPITKSKLQSFMTHHLSKLITKTII